MDPRRPVSWLGVQCFGLAWRTHGVIGWHISFAGAIAHHVPVNISPAIGVDCGIVNTLAAVDHGVGVDPRVP